MIRIDGNETTVEMVPVNVTVRNTTVHNTPPDYNRTVVDPAFRPDNHPGYLEPDYLPNNYPPYGRDDGDIYRPDPPMQDAGDNQLNWPERVDYPTPPGRDDRDIYRPDPPIIPMNETMPAPPFVTRDDEKLEYLPSE